MRRYAWVPLLALALTLGACSTSTAKAPRTVTEVVTETGTPPTTTGSAPTSGSDGITVVHTDGAGSKSGKDKTGPAKSTHAKKPGKNKPAKTKSETGKTKPKTTKKTKAKAPKKNKPKIVKVDPLHIACPVLLDASDINKVLGSKVSSANFRIVDVANPDVKMTGKIKCYFGANAKAKNRPVTVALAQYKSAGAAQSQMDVTVSSEKSLGAKPSTAKVSGHQAHILLRDGGLLVMRYGTWTLSVAVDKGVGAAKKLVPGLQAMARMVLARVIKNG